MALFDIFKKKPTRNASHSDAGGKEKKPQKIEEKEKPLKQKPPIQKREILKQKKSRSMVYGVVREPHISEKATNLGKVNQYVFKVFPRANKNEIKKAIESIYGVDVLAVNIITIPARKRRLGKTIGFKKGHKKAIVKIKEGQNIEIL
jgi:large subunit ribosomal protein L23